MLNEAETPAPGQTFTPRQLRILKIAVAIMSVLLVLGFGLLLIGVYLQASKIGKAPAVHIRTRGDHHHHDYTSTTRHCRRAGDRTQ